MAEKPPVIVFINFKGGVGKTLISLNAASKFADEHKTLFIDSDAQGNATKILFNNFFEGKNLLSLYQDKGFEIVKPWEGSGYKKAEDKQLFVLPGDNALLDRYQDIEVMAGAEEILKKQLKDSLSEYEYVIIDAPPDHGIFTRNALTIADYIIIPFKPSPQEWNGTAKLLSDIEKYRKDGATKAKLLGIVISMYISDKTKTHTQYIQELLNIAPKNSVFNIVIPRSQEYENAFANGVPIDLYGPADKSYKQVFAKLTEEIIARINKTSPRAKKE
jgi:chromosome partitioning protein